MSARTASPPAPAPAPAAPGSTRERILETALRLYSERGTGAVSMRELAEAAGVTVPGLYYHFASKADLIRDLYRSRGLGRGLDGGGAVEPEPLAAATVQARIVEQAVREFDRLVADEEFLRLMQRDGVLGDADALEVGRALAASWRVRWRAVLAGSDDLAPDADLDSAADAIPTFLWGLFVEYLNHHDDTTRDRIAAFARLVAPALRRGTR